MYWRSIVMVARVSKACNADLLAQAMTPVLAYVWEGKRENICSGFQTHTFTKLTPATPLQLGLVASSTLNIAKKKSK